MRKNPLYSPRGIRELKGFAGPVPEVVIFFGVHQDLLEALNTF